MKIFNTFLCLIAIFSFVNAQVLVPNYSRVKIDLSEHGIEKVAQLGLETDHGTYRPGRYLINDFSAEEVSILEDRGIEFEILIPDVQAHYVEQNKQSASRNLDLDCSVNLYPYVTPENYEYGSMGGYLTYSELLNTLDLMHHEYPHLISKREPIGNHLTHEGKPIYWLKIGDRPLLDEEEPKVLYTALHHAREANSLSQMVFYMWYLLENYERDEEVRFIVDHTSLYFVPCVNPDGYVYNEMTNPNGGGLWRKNRREIPGNGTGVDLNRNYGHQWAHDNIGSSSNPISETYRGTDAFSEPETMAIREFCFKHDFKIALNYHSYGNLMVYPWGYNDDPIADDLIFEGHGEALTNENSFLAGTALETVGYTVNGSSDDWMYAETGSLSFTPEVGSADFGFWPPQDKIDFLNKSVLAQNMIAALLLHGYVYLQEVEGDAMSLDFEVKKYSVDEDGISIEVNSLTEGLEMLKEIETVNLGHLESTEVSFPYVFENYRNSEDIVKLELLVHYNSYTSIDTIMLDLGSQEIVTYFEEVGDNIELWESDIWDVTNDFYFSESSSITDSPNGLYEKSSYSELTMAAPVDLSEAVQAKLAFYTRWEIEEDFDYAQVLISSDGEEFIPACGKYTEDGISFQDEGQPVYDGKQTSWVQEEIDLSPFLGGMIWIKFLLVSDEIEQLDGFYFDDLRVEVVEKLNSSLTGELETNEFKLLPNPFTDDFTIESQYDEEIVVNIYDRVGRRYERGSELPEGIYFVELLVEGKPRSMLKAIKIK